MTNEEKEEKCIICGSEIKDAGALRYYKRNWYCDSSFKSNHNCFKENWEEKSTYIEHIKISVKCPFCNNEVGDIILQSNEPKCRCGAEFSTNEDEVYFIRKRKIE